jgi:hypothetical protein
MRRIDGPEASLQDQPGSGANRRIVLVLIILGALYFVLFAFPNSTGAADPSMISVFQPDEFTQYSYLGNMIAFDHANFLHNLYSFIAYGHYYYGYPFYLSSALIALPVELAIGLRSQGTQIYLLLLRQFISVLPMILAVLVLTYVQTGFRSYIRSIFTFVLLLAIPAVVQNDMWWHPDSLTILFIALTFLFLDRDDLKFGRNFLLAAVACGLATATKLLGLFFFLAIPFYLLMGIKSGKLQWRRAVLKALQFVACMVIAIVVSNPFLLIPNELKEMVRIQSGQAAAMSTGWVLYYAKGPASWFPIITRSYGQPALLVFAAAVLLIWIIRRNPKRLLFTMILLWILPLSSYMLFMIATKPTHFLLPIFLPLVSCIPAVLPTLPAWRGGPSIRTWSYGDWMRALGVVALLGFGVYQIVWSLSADVPLYRTVLAREETNPQLAFYKALDRDYLSRLPADQDVLIYRDVRAYFPQSGNRRVRSFFNTTTYQSLDRIHPDIVILWRQRVLDYTNAESIQNAIDPAAFHDVNVFFADARKGMLRGYHVLYQNEADIAFVRDDLYSEYFIR